MIKIEISGPGSTFQNLTDQVQKFLESLGAEVSMETDLPPKYRESGVECSAEAQIKGRSVKIIEVNHPWGG